MTVLTPKLATAFREGDTIVIRGDGETVMVLSVDQARWFAARLAEALARRA